MTEVAGITIGSIFFIVIIVLVVVLGILALLTPVFIYQINLRVKELLQEQKNANLNINEEIQKSNERLDELQKTCFLLLSKKKNSNIELESKQTTGTD